MQKDYKNEANSDNISAKPVSGESVVHRFHPVFNLDYQFFTPAFVLDCDIVIIGLFQSKCVSNSDYLKQSFLNKTE